MWVKRNEDNEVVSIFIGCTPIDTEGYEEIPDDYELMEELRRRNDAPVKDTPTKEDRITALEDALTAIEEGIASV